MKPPQQQPKQILQIYSSITLGQIQGCFFSQNEQQQLFQEKRRTSQIIHKNYETLKTMLDQIFDLVSYDKNMKVKQKQTLKALQKFIFKKKEDGIILGDPIVKQQQLDKIMYANEKTNFREIIAYIPVCLFCDGVGVNFYAHIPHILAKQALQQKFLLCQKYLRNKELIPSDHEHDPWIAYGEKDAEFLINHSLRVMDPKRNKKVCLQREVVIILDAKEAGKSLRGEYGAQISKDDPRITNYQTKSTTNIEYQGRKAKAIYCFQQIMKVQKKKT